MEKPAGALTPAGFLYFKQSDTVRLRIGCLPPDTLSYAKGDPAVSENPAKFIKWDLKRRRSPRIIVTRGIEPAFRTQKYDKGACQDER